MAAKLSKHARVDRFDRISAIVDLFKGDLGETVISVWDEKHNAFQELTSNGVLIAKGKNGTVITMFLCNPGKATVLQSLSGKYLTKNQWRRIEQNQKFQTLCIQRLIFQPLFSIQKMNKYSRLFIRPRADGWGARHFPQSHRLPILPSKTTRGRTRTGILKLAFVEKKCYNKTKKGWDTND